MTEIVVSLPLADEKSKITALKAVARIKGVECVAVDMEKKKITLIGEADPVIVASKLRKFANVKILSVRPAKEEDFQGFVCHCLAESFYNRAAFSEGQISVPGNSFRLKKATDSPVMGRHGRKVMEQAWKEVYRVLKEAEIYLNCCSDMDWGINSITLPFTGEAYAIHLHDLAWSLVCLDLNALFLELGEEPGLLQFGRDGGNLDDSQSIRPGGRGIVHNCPNPHASPVTISFPCISKPKEVEGPSTRCLTDERYNEAACRKMGDFFAEMSNSNRVNDEYQDKRGLIFSFNQFSNAHKRTAQGSSLRLNVEDKSKAGISKFVEAKLRASIRNETAIIGGRVSPWLQIDIKDLIISHTVIGEGSGAVVYEGSWLGVKVALKTFQINNYTMDEEMQAEVAVHAKLSSPFIVQLIGVCVTETRCYHVLELVSSSLDSILKRRLERNELPLPLPIAVDMMLQISRGMEYLHSQKIMHMDLKAANVLIEPSPVPEFRYQGYGRVRLCDFGHASLRLHSFRCSDWAKGTSYWRAPEVFTQQDLEIEAEPLKEYTYKADVYSFSMTCYEILTGKQPFEGVLPKNVFTKIVQGERPYLPSSCPLVLVDYISKCWDTDPRRRPCFAQVSNFLRYIKLLIMRPRDSCGWDSLSAICKGFDKHELVRCGEEGDLDERAAYLEEERIIIRALDGDSPGFFFRHPVSHQMAQPSSPRVKFFSNLPVYIQQYTCDEIVWATDCFSTKVSGASPVMWKATLRDGTHVAVKKQNLEFSLGEINVICRLHHPNIVRLRGVSVIPCTSTPEQSMTFLAYDQMAMGSLSALLICPTDILNWNLRKKIGLGIAHFIAYLHDIYGKMRHRLLELQITSNNIYLDERFTPKFCGFESAKYINNSNSGVKELERALQFEEHRNVKDFGVILLELLSGCRRENIQYLLSSIHRPMKTEGSEFLSRLLDRKLQGKVDEGEAMGWVKLALWCFSQYPAVPPTMNQVVLVMKRLKAFSALPSPVIG